MNDQLIGKELANGRFKIIGDKPLGKGGFATVYLGIQKQLNRKVAIKVLSQNASEDEGIVKRFIREARVVAMFDHPNIIKVIDSGSEDGTHYFVMNYLPSSLHNLMSQPENVNGLPLSRWLQIAKDIASALNYMHHHTTVKEFIHRDIKPGNIMFDDSNHAVLTDFGLVKSDEFSQLTLKDTVMGTPKYMSPEQVRGTQLDHRSDLYSFGIVLYEMLVGRPPFSGEPLTICHKQIAEDPPALHTIKPGVAPELESIILKLIEKEPGNRYQSASALLAALEEWENKTRSQNYNQSADWSEASATAPTLIKPQKAATLLESPQGMAPQPGGSPADVKIARREQPEMSNGISPSQFIKHEKKRSMIKWGGLFTAVVLSAMIIYLVQQKNKPPQVGFLRLESTPPGAMINVNGEPKNMNTPNTIAANVGDTLIIDLSLENFKPESLQFVIFGTDTETYAVQFQPVQPTETKSTPATTKKERPEKIRTLQEAPVDLYGSIEVSSTPSGATIYQNRKEIGKTPTTIQNVPQGKVEIRLEIPGYHEWKEEVTVEANKIKKIDQKLIAKPGSLSINCDPENVRISIDGKDYGTTPIVINDLLAKKEPYLVTAKKFEYESQTIEVTINPGESKSLVFKLEKKRQ